MFFTKIKCSLLYASWFRNSDPEKEKKMEIKIYIVVIETRFYVDVWFSTISSETTQP